MPSRVRSLLFRLAGRPLPSPAEGAVTTATIMLAVTTGFVALAYYGLSHREAVPFADPGVLGLSLAVLTGLVIPAWVALLVAGWLARRRRPDSPLLAHAAVQLLMLENLFGGYVLGRYTDPTGTGGFLASTVLALLLFEGRIVRTGIVSYLAITVVLTVLEQVGALPYGPLVVKPPVEGGRLAAAWLLRGAWTIVVLVALAFFVATALELARDREERFRRATHLIRRYVPTQLAERILAGEHTATAPPQRRRLTLFFSDVVEFTNAADRMEAEDLSALLNEYLSEMAAIADVAGATVNQFVGDGIMIFFGAPEATTDRDHALRAVRMAMAMQQRMRELGEQWFEEGIQTPFRIRIGINTGVASVGDFGSEGRTTYSAIGNQTNLTARIQEHCEPGKVLISHTTWALVKDEIPCRERGEIEAKGLHYPVRVYEVTEASDG